MCTGIDRFANSFVKITLQQSCAGSGPTFDSQFSMVGGYMEDLKTPQTVNIWGWAFAQGWMIAHDNTVYAFRKFLFLWSDFVSAIFLTVYFAIQGSVYSCFVSS